MSRILVVGQCPLPFEEVSRLYAPGLRTWQFTKALLDDGHTVYLVCGQIPFTYDGANPASESSEGNLSLVRVDEETFKGLSLLQSIHDSFEPDGLVAVNRFPASVAVRLETEKPIWADIFGHAMAEAQVKAQVYDDDSYLRLFWQEEQEIIDRADVFSAVSQPQAFALIGELGTRGRLNKASVGYEFVHPIPSAVTEVKAEEPCQGTKVRGVSAPDDAFIVLWSGGYNTWTDVDTLFAGVSLAMSRDPRIVFVSTGGAIAGHDELTYARFEDLVFQSDLRSRFFLKGWVPTSEVSAYLAESDVGINIDAFTYEGVLGARTRMLDWMKAGLPILTTVTCELTEILAREKLAFTFTHGDASDLADQLLRLASDREVLQKTGVAAMNYALQRFSYAETTRPLRDWAREPWFAPDRGRRVALQEAPPSGGVAVDPRSPASARNFFGRWRKRPQPGVLFPEIRFIGHDIPEEMQVGRTYRVRISLRIDSIPDDAPGDGGLNLSYHWHRDGVEVIHDGLRTPLDLNLAGQEREILAWVKAPPEAGEYLLQFDLVREGLAWLNHKGADGTTRVKVSSAAMRP